MPASEDDVMRLVAELQDNFSPAMLRMQKSLDAFSKSAKQAHQTNTAQVRDQTKAYTGLDQSVKQIADRTRSVLSPALMAAGVSILSVSAAVAALVKATTAFGETTQKLVRLGRETGLTSEKLRELDSLATGIGSSPDAMNAGLRLFAKNMEEFRRGVGTTAEFFISQHDAGIQAIGAQVRAAKDNTDAMTAALEGLKHIHAASGLEADTVAMKKSYLAAFGIIQEFATLSDAEWARLVAANKKAQGEMAAGWKERGTALAESMYLLKSAVGGTADMLGDSLAPSFTKASDAAEKFIELNRGPLIGSLKELFAAIDNSSLGKFAQSLTEIGFAATAAITKVVELNNLFDGSALGKWLAGHGMSAGKIMAGAATGGLGFVDYGALGKFLGGDKAPAIPGFAAGGVVTDDMLAAVHKGEIVIPAGGGSSGLDAIKKPVMEGTETGTRKGVFDGMRDWYDYQKMASLGGGAGGVGGGSGLGAGAGGSTGGAGATGDTGLPSPPNAAASFEDRFKGEQTGAGGAAFLKDQRAGMAEEVKRDPKLAATLRGVLASEDARDPAGPMEALANRSALYDSMGKHKSLHDLLYGGFYGPLNRGQVRPSNDPKMQAGMDKVFAGSNRLKGATDQGSSGDPNAAWQGGRILPPGASRGAIYNDWGGLGHDTARRFRESQQKQMLDADTAASERAAHPATLTPLDLLTHAKRSGLVGGGTQKVEGSAGVTVDFKNMPRGVLTRATVDGLFKQVSLNRGTVMPLATEGA